MKTAAITREVDRIVEQHDSRVTASIGILQDIQNRFSYLPEEALGRLAERLGVPLSRVYSLATFFKAFSLKPRGEHLICVCLGTACHVRGAPRLLDEVQRQLGIRPGETTEDNRFTLEAVNCLGACALGPLMVIDGEYHGNMDAKKLESVLNEYRKRKKAKK